MSVDLVWELADTFNILMAIPNLIALTLLSGLIAKITKNYFKRKKGIHTKPILSYDEEQNKKMFVESLEEDGIDHDEALKIYDEIITYNPIDEVALSCVKIFILKKMIKKEKGIK